jgi:hypothetical protein
MGLPSILAVVTFTPIIAGLSYAERMPLSRRPGCDWREDPAAHDSFRDTMFTSAPMIATKISGLASAIEATAVSYCAGRSSTNEVQDRVRHCFARHMGAVWTSTRPEDRSGILWRVWMAWCCRRIVHRPHRVVSVCCPALRDVRGALQQKGGNADVKVHLDGLYDRWQR